MRSRKSSTSSRKTAYSDVAALASIHMPAPPYLFTFSTPVKLIRPHCIRCSNINFNDIFYPRDAVPTAPPPLGIAAPVIAPVTPVSPSPSLQSSTKHNAHQLEYRDKLHAGSSRVRPRGHAQTPEGPLPLSIRTETHEEDCVKTGAAKPDGTNDRTSRYTKLWHQASP